MHNLVLPDSAPKDQRQLVVDLSKRSLFVCLSAKPIFVFDKKEPSKVVENHFWDEDVQVIGECTISAGKPSTPTPTGFFLGKKERYGRGLAKFGGGKLEFIVRLEGHVLIHAYFSVPLDLNASHGCVRMFLLDSRVLWPWVPNPVPVYVVDTTLPDL